MTPPAVRGDSSQRGKYPTEVRWQISGRARTPSQAGRLSICALNPHSLLPPNTYFSEQLFLAWWGKSTESKIGGPETRIPFLRKLLRATLLQLSWVRPRMEERSKEESQAAPHPAPHLACLPQPPLLLSLLAKKKCGWRKKPPGDAQNTR